MDAKAVYMERPWMKFYPEGVPEDIEPPVVSVPDVFDQVVEKYGGKTALVFYGKKISYVKLKEMIDRMATALADLGVAKGDTVALYLLNSPQYVITYFAALKLGAKITPISPVYTSQEVKHQLTDSDAKTVVCEFMLYDNLVQSGVTPDRVIITNIADFLPPLKKLFGKALSGKLPGKNRDPGPRSRSKPDSSGSRTC